MSFLAPLFLAGIAAIAGPIVFHLIRRTTRQKQPFSSLMFLQPSPPRISRRHRFEHLLLLLLRCAALALLALGFARPFFRSTADQGAGPTRTRREVILVDVSASMRRSGLWDAARTAVHAQLRAVGEGDDVAVLAFDDRTSPVLSFAEWKQSPPGERVSTATERLESITPGWRGTHLGQALIAAADALEDSDDRNANADKRIVLISDVQAGCKLDGLQGYEWPKDVQAYVVPLKSATHTNAGLQVLAEPSDAATKSTRIRVRVSNTPGATREQFRLGWAGLNGAAVGSPIDAYVPAGQSRAFSVPLAADGAAADRLVLQGDDEPFDNTVFIVPTVRRTAAVLWLGHDDPGDNRSELTFLRRAFSDTSRINVRVIAAGADGAPTPAQWSQADLIFAAGEVAPEDASGLRGFVNAGKTAVVVLEPGTNADALAALLGHAVHLSEASPENYAMFGDIDFRSPLFASFADPRFSDFTKIHVWHYRRVDLSEIGAAHVIARFDNGDPAVAEVPIGGGHVVLFATGWQPEDSQLAVSSKFVPMMWSLLDMSGAATMTPPPVYVGAPLPVPRGASAVRRPDGSTMPLTPGAHAFSETEAPGIYEFIAPQPVRVAVNLDPSESRTAPLGLDELEQLGVPLRPDQPRAGENPRSAALSRAADIENRQKAWRWIIAATLLVLLAESVAAAWSGRRAAHTPPEAIA